MKAVSRQSKTLMGIALLALGIYLWFNYLAQNNSSFLPPFLNNNQTVSTVDPSSNSSYARIQTVGDSNTTKDNQGNLVVAPLSNSGSEIQVVSPNLDFSATTAAREVIIVDLPFLITEPPSENIEDSDAIADGVAQNQHLRVTVNPFSPIVIEEGRDKNRQTNANQNNNTSSVQTVSGQARPHSTTVVGQTGQTKAVFKAPTELIKSTPLRTVTPAPSLANNLPRTLSNGTLSATPGILRNQNVVPPLASEVAAAKKAAEEAAALAEKERLEAEQAAAIAAAEAEQAAAIAAAEAEQAAAIAAAEAEAEQAAAIAAAEAEQAAVNVVSTPIATEETNLSQEAVAEAKLPVLKNPGLRTPHTGTPNIAIASSPTQVSSPAALPGLLQSGRDAARIEISTSQNTVEQPTEINEIVGTSEIAETNQTVKIDFENADVIDNPNNTVEDPNISGGPTEAGVSELTRYLRDYNFEYTGSVIGAVRSVGMFRTNVSATPITITLGQNIPKTDIVLTNLQNNQAEFTQGQDKVILNLDLRR